MDYIILKNCRQFFRVALINWGVFFRGTDYHVVISTEIRDAGNTIETRGLPW